MQGRCWRRLAVISSLAAGLTACDAEVRTVTFEAPPGFEQGAQLLTVEGPEGVSYFAADVGETLPLGLSLAPGQAVSIEAWMYPRRLSDLPFGSGRLSNYVEDDGAAPPTPSAVLVRSFDGAGLGPWTATDRPGPAAAALRLPPRRCPTLVPGEVALDLEEELAFVSSADGEAVLLADPFEIVEWRDERVRTVSTTVAPMTAGLATAAGLYVGFADGRIGRVVGFDPLRLEDVHRVSAAVDEVVGSPGGDEVWVNSVEGEVAVWREGVWTQAAGALPPGDRVLEVVWVGPGHFVLTDRDRVYRFENGAVTEERTEAVGSVRISALGLVGSGLTAAATVGGTERTFLARDTDGVWRPTWSIDLRTQDVRAFLDRGDELFYVGSAGTIGVFRPASGETCPFGALSRGDFRRIVPLADGRLFVVDQRLGRGKRAFVVSLD